MSENKALDMEDPYAGAPNFDRFFRVLAEAESLFPGAPDQMFEDWVMNDDEKEKLRNGMTRAINAMKGID